MQKPWASINDWMHAMNVNRFKGNDLKKYYTGIAAEYAHEQRSRPDGRPLT